MLPAAAKFLAPLIQITESGEMQAQGKPINFHQRYSSHYVTIVVRSHLYHVPASALAWYKHTGVWPDRAVRHKDRNPLNFSKVNLKRARNTNVPEVIAARRLTGEELRGYTGLRYGGADLSLVVSEAT